MPVAPQVGHRLLDDLPGLCHVATLPQQVRQRFEAERVPGMLATVEGEPLLNALAQLRLGLVESSRHAQRQAQIESVGQLVLAGPVIARRRGDGTAVTLDRAIE
ncbi:hypothetical protein OG617_01695 [Micromonospora sp. NBC_01412]